MGFQKIAALPGETITLPGVPGANGELRDYTINSPSASYGLWLTRLTVAMGSGDPTAAATEPLDDDPTASLKAAADYARLLGPAYEQMLQDGVSAVWMRHVAVTVTIWVIADQGAAEAHWNAAGDPPAAPNRAARRASSAAATSTPKRGSTSGTSPSKATKTRSKAARKTR